MEKRKWISRFITFFGVFLLLSMSLSLVACSDTSDDVSSANVATNEAAVVADDNAVEDKTSAEPEHVGFWIYREDGGLQIVNLRSDDTLSIDLFDEATNGHMAITGRYSIDGSNLMMTDVLTDGVADEDMYSVFSVNGDELTLDQFQYQRVTEAEARNAVPSWAAN